mmetsp:Transcript_9187/g.18695  ORF Transcript_9187/g.18695 Transcript_9187/m.18695 type:complete len:83 (-) Transcript_9187:1544-1792(-)
MNLNCPRLLPTPNSNFQIGERLRIKFRRTPNPRMSFPAKATTVGVPGFRSSGFQGSEANCSTVAPSWFWGYEADPRFWGKAG